MSRLGSLRSGPLGVRSFRLLAGGQFTSTIGDYCYAVALPWLVLSTHGSAILLGTVLACYGVPRTVAVLPGGGRPGGGGHPVRADPAGVPGVRGENRRGRARRGGVSHGTRGANRGVKPRSVRPK